MGRRGDAASARPPVIDTGKSNGIRNTFDLVPDAPVSKFTLSMNGGKKGLLVNSENICGKLQHALATSPPKTARSQRPSR